MKKKSSAPRPRKRNSRRRPPATQPTANAPADERDELGSDRRKNDVLSRFGHELRNPLSALVHGLALLGKVSDDRTRAEELRGMMVRQTKRIGTLLDELLDVTGVISGKGELSKDRVELKGDAVRLTQIVENLLTNAVKYTDRGSERAPAKPDKIRPRRILLVDDEVDAGRVLADILELDGHKTLTVNDGPAALAAVRTFDPEAVLLALSLPEMDGYEVARRLRKGHPDKKILLIAVTGYQKDVARLKQAGFDQYMIKPANTEKLSALLAAWDVWGRTQ